MAPQHRHMLAGQERLRLDLQLGQQCMGTHPRSPAHQQVRDLCPVVAQRDQVRCGFGSENHCGMPIRRRTELVDSQAHQEAYQIYRPLPRLAP